MYYLVINPALGSHYFVPGYVTFSAIERHHPTPNYAEFLVSGKYRTFDKEHSDSFTPTCE